MRPRDPSSHRVSSDTARRVDRLERKSGSGAARAARSRVLSFSGEGTATVSASVTGTAQWTLAAVTWGGDAPVSLDADWYDTTVWAQVDTTERDGMTAKVSAGATGIDWQLNSGNADQVAGSSGVLRASVGGLLYVDGDLGAQVDVGGLVEADVVTLTSIRVLMIPRGIGSS